MVLGTLCETYDESLYSQFCSAIENIRKDSFVNNLKFDVRNGTLNPQRAGYFYFMMQRISQRAHMETKNWIDKVLLKIKALCKKIGKC